MNFKATTQAVAYNLQDEVLAVHLQLLAESVVRVLVYLYVAGQMTFEVVQPYLTWMGEAFVYRTTWMGDSESVDMTDTIPMQKFN